MLNRALEQVRTVAIGGHIRPDGDCAGSCMALYQYVKKCLEDICYGNRGHRCYLCGYQGLSL